MARLIMERAAVASVYVSDKGSRRTYVTFDDLAEGGSVKVTFDEPQEMKTGDKVSVDVVVRGGAFGKNQSLDFHQGSITRLKA